MSSSSSCPKPTAVQADQQEEKPPAAAFVVLPIFGAHFIPHNWPKLVLGKVSEGDQLRMGQICLLLLLLGSVNRQLAIEFMLLLFPLLFGSFDLNGKEEKLQEIGGEESFPGGRWGRGGGHEGKIMDGGKGNKLAGISWEPPSRANIQANGNEGREGN
jgi:hypothetical protein